jgi:putative DNA primase/helicase
MRVYPNSSPRTLSGSHRRIPEDLKQDNSWVLWRYVERDGRRTKEPYQANRRRASSADPATWTTFCKALEAYEQDDFFDGLGIVFHDGNPYAGADFDDTTEEQAREWLDRFDSYSERSPSGTGLHVIIKAELPNGTNRRGRGELYSSGRFFTMSGDVIRDTPVREAQDAADEFYAHLRRNDRKAPVANATRTSFDTPDLDDNEVLRLLETAKNGHVFATIYAGGGEFASGSERDLSLANRIAFYSQDEDQIERIMRDSGCARAKWDKHRTYLRDTIRKAIRGLTNTYTPAGTPVGVTNIKTVRASKKNELQAGVRDLVRRWRDFDWARVKGTAEKPNWMRGFTCRDVMIVLISQAAKNGKVSGDDIEVSLGRRKLALQAATSLRTVHKSVRHLEKEGWLEFRPPSKADKVDGLPGVYVLRASLHQVLTISTVGRELEDKEGGGEDLRGADAVPRLRWSAPYIRRLGKHNGAIIEHLVSSEAQALAGGDLHVEELAEATNKRTRDLLRRNLPKLQEAGIIVLDGNIVRLAADWREALERKREEDGEIYAHDRDQKKYREQGEAFRNRDKTPADEEPPLMGREKMAEVLAERAKEEEERRIEHQRQKVGATAETFIHDKLKLLGRIRLGLLRDVYADAGGDSKDVLPAAVRLGCRIERFAECQNERFVLPGEAMKMKVA